MSIVATTGYFRFLPDRIPLSNLETLPVCLSISTMLPAHCWSDAYGFYSGNSYFAVYYKAVQSFLPPLETSTVLTSRHYQHVHTLTPLPVSRLEDFFASYWAEEYPLQAMAALTRGT